MAGIRVSSSVQTIDVNDNGDTIVVRGDVAFLTKFYQFTKYMVDASSELQKKVEDCRRAGDTEAVVDAQYEYHKNMHDALELLFGEGTCRKVFGGGSVDVLPTADAVIEFIEQLTPYIDKAVESMKKGKTPSKKSIKEMQKAGTFADMLARSAVESVGTDDAEEQVVDAEPAVTTKPVEKPDFMQRHSIAEFSDDAEFLELREKLKRHPSAES